MGEGEERKNEREGKGLDFVMGEGERGDKREMKIENKIQVNERREEQVRNDGEAREVKKRKAREGRWRRERGEEKGKRERGDGHKEDKPR